MAFSPTKFCADNPAGLPFAAPRHPSSFIKPSMGKVQTYECCGIGAIGQRRC